MTLWKVERIQGDGRVTNAHHLAPGGLGDLHLLQHLVPLLHDQGSLVGVGGHVRVVHLDHVNLSFNSGKKIFRFRSILRRVSGDVEQQLTLIDREIASSLSSSEWSCPLPGPR